MNQRDNAGERSAIKGAELLGGVGALVLGGGLTLLAPEPLAPFAWTFILVGGIAHAFGMYSKRQLEARTATVVPWWERALYWLCWLLLLGIAVFGVTRVLVI